MPQNTVDRMTEPFIDRAFGRQAFGLDPAGYDAARPAYPDWVFDFLRQRCGLAPYTVTFEIGAGTGTATRQLLELGANPLVAIEPDERLAAFLRKTVPDQALSVVVAPFEDAVLQEASFDLGLSATSFHWLNEDVALTKVAKLLRPGGWWAMLWNVFGDSGRPDAFHEATKLLLNNPLSPSAGNGNVPLTQTVLQNVEVVTAGQTIEPDPQGKPQSVNVVTLLLNPEDSQKLQLASAQGNIQFVLRSGADEKKVAELRPTRLDELSTGAKPVVPVVAAPGVKRAPKPAPQTPIYLMEVIQGTQRSVQKF